MHSLGPFSGSHLGYSLTLICFSPAYICPVFMTVVSLIQTSSTPHPAGSHHELGQGSEVRLPALDGQVWTQQDQNHPSTDCKCWPSGYVSTSGNFFPLFSSGFPQSPLIGWLIQILISIDFRMALLKVFNKFNTIFVDFFSVSALFSQLFINLCR